MRTSPRTKRFTDGRRNLLKTAGLSIALPMLESRGRAEEADVTSESFANLQQRDSNPAQAQRLICVGSNLGLYRPALYPEGSGQHYAISPLLEPLKQHRENLTLFSGLDHRAANGHDSWDNYLCGNRIGSVSLDQIAAEQIGQSTRFQSMQLCAGDIPRQRMVFTREGVPLPMINRPSVVYKKMFVVGKDRERTDYILRSGRSSLDLALDDAKRLQRNVSESDRQKLSEYFTSLRELERRMTRQLNHLADDAKEVDYVLPPFDPIAPTMMLECEQIMFDLMALALQTDNTRVATLFIAGLGQVFTLDGKTLQAGYHALSHHGNDPDLIRDLIRVETEHMRCFARFLNQLKTKTDADGRPLLDTTIVMFGTGMGDASRHSNRDLPTMVAGGGLRHGSHRAYSSETSDRRLGNVFVSILQQLGLPADKFGEAKGPVEGWA